MLGLSLTGNMWNLATTRWHKAIAAGLLCLTLAACGGDPTSFSSGKVKVDPKYGVKPSPRVVRNGKPVPKGGGRYMVGKPYTIAGKRYYPKEQPNYRERGKASWYGAAFHGRKTANGEIFDKESLTAAHPTLPLPSYVHVTNLKNGRSMTVRVNDRGPFHGNRILDVSERVASMLGFKHDGIGQVEVKYLKTARLDGQDERYLLASYQGPGAGSRTMIARADPPKQQRGLSLFGGSRRASANSRAPLPQRDLGVAAVPIAVAAAPVAAAPVTVPSPATAPNNEPILLQTYQSQVASNSGFNADPLSASILSEPAILGPIDGQALDELMYGNILAPGSDYGLAPPPGRFTTAEPRWMSYQNTPLPLSYAPASRINVAFEAIEAAERLARRAP